MCNMTFWKRKINTEVIEKICDGQCLGVKGMNKQSTEEFLLRENALCNITWVHICSIHSVTPKECSSLRVRSKATES